MSRATLTERLNRRQPALEELESRLTWMRTLTFLIFVAAVLSGAAWPQAAWPAPVGLLFFLAFLVLARRHRHLRAHRAAREQRLRLDARLRAMATLDWKSVPASPEWPDLARRPGFRDLDLVGENSFLRLIHLTATRSGFQELADLFADDQPRAELVRERRDFVRALSRHRVLTRRFELAGQDAGRLVDTDELRRLAEVSLAGPQARAALITGFVVHGALWAAFFRTMAMGGSSLVPAAFLILIVAYPWIAKQLRFTQAYAWAMSMDRSLYRLTELAHALEGLAKSPQPILRKQLSSFVPERAPSLRLRAVARAAGALGVKQNFLLHLFIHLLGPWDVFWTWRLEIARQAVLADLSTWTAELARFESLLSICEFSRSRPELCEPIVLESGPARLSAKDLRHPLLPAGKKIGNDFEIGTGFRCLILTGSNMSGKSTFLRTLGLNLLIAQAGGRVDAQEFSFTPMILRTSLRVVDSVDEGLSTFYAEVRQLKQIHDDARDRDRILYLIDEIFRGTNNRERILGARALIDVLSRRPALGVVATHDLELTQLASAERGIENGHFQEQIINDRMTFDHRLRSGPCPTTNALRIMELEGLPVPDSVRA